jgi:adenosylcobinamide-GDP ribazoletransferase
MKRIWTIITDGFKAFCAALTNLTVIPAPGYRFREIDLERSKPFFPFVGLAVGGILYLAGYFLPGLGAVLPALLVILPVLLTRGFHLDGLADTADAFMSSRGRDRMLEIMRDSHIGTMGVFAITAVLGLQFTVLIGLTQYFLPLTVLFAAICGRSAIVIYICLSRYVRQEGGAALVFKRRSRLNILWCSLFMLAAGYGLLAWPGAAAALAVIVFAFGWHFYTRRKIGGGTGDTVGACEILSETVAMLAFFVLHFLERTDYFQ